MIECRAVPCRGDVHLSSGVRTSVKGYCQTARSARKRVRAKTAQDGCIGSTHGNLLSDVRWLQLPSMTAHTICMAGIPLLAHGLTVKLSPCPCSHSSPAGRIAACLCGHSKCKLFNTRSGSPQDDSASF